MKALILAGGRGKRLEGLTETKNKSLLSIGEKPLIEYNLENAINSGINEIVLVVGYRAEDIINRYGINFNGAKIRYSIQKEQRGLVNAIETAKEELENSDFLLMLADEVLINPKIKDMINKFYQENVFGLCGVVKEKEKKKISKTYTILKDNDNRILRLIEKPENPLTDYQGTGHCLLKSEILDYISKTPINSKRGERELVDLIQVAVDDGRIVKLFEISEKYTNVNTQEDYEYGKFILGK